MYVEIIFKIRTYEAKTFTYVGILYEIWRKVYINSVRFENINFEW
jgi:hypothetical protein